MMIATVRAGVPCVAVAESLLARMVALEEETIDNDRLRLWICFDYGGRAELVEAVREIAASASSSMSAGATPDSIRRRVASTSSARPP